MQATSFKRYSKKTCSVACVYLHWRKLVQHAGQVEPNSLYYTGDRSNAGHTNVMYTRSLFCSVRWKGSKEGRKEERKEGRKEGRWTVGAGTVRVVDRFTLFRNIYN